MSKRLLVAGLIAFATPAWAGDGALEINQACIAVGCVPADGAGFPVQTLADTKYVLTSSLVVSSPNTYGVLLATGASLDLNDFTIAGPTSCSGDPVVCSNTGSGDGVQLGDGSVLRDGTIRGFGRYGVLMREANLVDAVHVTSNGGHGIHGNARGQVIRGCRIHHNGGHGINNPTAIGGALVGSVLTQNSIYDNGGRGISAGGGAVIVGNSIHRNADVGIFGNSDAGYGGNNLGDNNAGGAQVSSADQIGTNVCGGDTTCP